MPLLDHFHPPIKNQYPWDSFNSTWATRLAISAGTTRVLVCRKPREQHRYSAMSSFSPIERGGFRKVLPFWRSTITWA